MEAEPYSSYMAYRVLHPFFWLSIYAFAKPADIEFPREMILQLAEQQVGLQMMKY